MTQYESKNAVYRAYSITHITPVLFAEHWLQCIVKAVACPGGNPATRIIPSSENS